MWCLILGLLTVLQTTMAYKVLDTAEEWVQIQQRGLKDIGATQKGAARRLQDDWATMFPKTQARCDQVDERVANPMLHAGTVREWADDDRRPIAEYEPMQGVTVACIHKDSIGEEWGGFGVPVALLEEIARDDMLYVLVSPADNYDAFTFCKNILSQANHRNIEYIGKTLDTWWTRDYGAFWATNSKDGAFVVDHIYNRVYKVDWDFGGCRINDNEVPIAMAKHFHVPVEKAPAVLTGGNYMVTMGGDVMLVDKVYDNNQPSLAISNGFRPFTNWTADEVQMKLKETLRKHYGIRNVYTPSDPQDTYIDHVDTWGKFVKGADGEEVLVLGRYPEGNINYAAMEQLVLDVTRLMTNATGRVPTIKRVTLAEQDTDGSYVYGFYMNSLMLNQKLFVPTIAGKNGTAIEVGSAADRLNQHALSEWEDILGEGFTVFGYSFNVPAVGAGHDEYPPENDASTWNIWFTWDALHCRTRGVPDLAYFKPKRTCGDVKKAYKQAACCGNPHGTIDL